MSGFLICLSDKIFCFSSAKRHVRFFTNKKKDLNRMELKIFQAVVNLVREHEAVS